MPDYSKALIYAIISPKLFKIYIGSTTQTLNSRMGKHKKRNSKCSSKQILKQTDAQYFIVEKFPCNSSLELRRREGEIIKAMSGLCINRRIAGRTPQERRSNLIVSKQNKLSNT